MMTLVALSIIGVCYSYFIYPAVLLLMPSRRDNVIYENKVKPSVTFIIAAHNEASRIEQKLIDSLSLDYPAELIEIIVASDASSDGTDDVVRRFENDGVRLIRASERRGKENAQALAIGAAKGDILVFSDVSTRVPKDGLHILAESFKNPIVGAVSSEDIVVSTNGEPQGEGAYVRYEMWLRRLESTRNSLIGLSGSFFAARKEVCRLWDISLPSDLNTALNCARKGMVAISNPDLHGYYAAIADDSKEYQRKYRTAVRGMSAIFGHPELLNPFKYGLFAFQIFSHKVMRWLVPVFLVVMFSTSTVLAGDHWIYAALLILQIVFYTLALVGGVSEKCRKSVILKFPYYFVHVS